MAERIDVLLKLYEDNATMVRRHDEQRDRMTNLILIISGVLITFISQSKLALYALPAAGTLILLGIYGWLFAKKHYERTQIHASMISEIRMEIDRELGVLPWPEVGQQTLPKRSIKQIRGDADSRHYAEFPHPTRHVQKSAKSRVARLRLHPFWEGLHLVVILLGVLLSSLIVVQRWTDTENRPVEIHLVD